MAYLIAVLMAALSFLLNRVILRVVGLKTVITYGPALEEAAKTLLAYQLGADIFATHVVFGFVEAVYDWATSERQGLVAAMMSILGHSIFGLVTISAVYLSGSIMLALITAILAHLAWNITMIRLLA